MRPKRLNGVGVYIATDILAARMVYRVAIETNGYLVQAIGLVGH